MQPLLWASEAWRRFSIPKIQAETLPRLLSHPPVRGHGELPPRRLEGVGACGEFADSRIRPRAGTNCRDLSRPRRAARSRPLVRARRELLRVPGMAPVHPGRLDSLPVQRISVSPTRGRRHIYYSQVPGIGVPATRRHTGTTPE